MLHTLLRFAPILPYVLYYFHLPPSQGLGEIVGRSKQRSDMATAAIATWTAWPRASFAFASNILPHVLGLSLNPSCRVHTFLLPSHFCCECGRFDDSTDRWMDVWQDGRPRP